MPISKFKATCLAVLERVRRTGQPIVITKRGVAVARIDLPAPADLPNSGFGCMRGTVEELGDIVGPSGDFEDWEDAVVLNWPE